VKLAGTVLSVAAAAPLFGCFNADVIAAEKAERQVVMLEYSGATTRELCDARKQVRDAWLKAENLEKFEWSREMVSITCRRADQIDRGY
jgi:hypothetical protein